MSAPREEQTETLPAGTQRCSRICYFSPTELFTIRGMAIPDTSTSLLERLRTQPDDAGWQRLLALYQPLLQNWLRRYGLQSSDVDDLVQEILLTVTRELPKFHYDPKRGAFRSWLRTILVNRLRMFWRTRQAQPQTIGDPDFQKNVLEKLEDPASDLSRQWDQEHDRTIVQRLMVRVDPEFVQATWRAFRRVVLEGMRPAAVASELGMTVN